MSSSAEQESRVDSQVAKALEAVKDPFLRKIAERFQKEPNQVLKLSEILGFTIEEEKNTKALIWLKKHEPERYQAVLNASRAENKKLEKEKMQIEWGDEHFDKEIRVRLDKLFARIEAMLAKSLVPDENLRFIRGHDVLMYGNRGVLRVARLSSEDFDYCKKYNLLWNRRVAKTGFDIEFVLSAHPSYAYEVLKKNRNWPDLRLYVRNKEFLNAVKKFGRIYEKRSRRSVTVSKEY